jgi:hypothetical protein
LSTRGPALDDDGLQAFRRAIDGSAQSRWPGTVNRQVVFRSRRILEPAELLRDLPDGRALQPGAVREDAHRQPLIVQLVDLRRGARLLVAPQLDPAEQHSLAVEKVPQRVRFGRTARAEVLNPGLDFVHECFPNSSSRSGSALRLQANA